MADIFPWDLTVVVTRFPDFFQAAVVTLEITAAGIVCGVVVGFVFALMKVSYSRVLKAVASAYIFIVRGTPLLLQLFIIYYGLTTVVAIPPFPSAIFALGFHNGAYIAEIFRGAIESIPVGQMEAARSIGMSHRKAMQRIILPQALKRAIPPLGNQFIIALKDSSLASTIAVPELLLRGRQLGSSTFMYMEMLIIVAVYYLILTTMLNFILSQVDKKLASGKREVRKIW